VDLRYEGWRQRARWQEKGEEADFTPLPVEYKMFFICQPFFFALHLIRSELDKCSSPSLEEADKKRTLRLPDFIENFSLDRRSNN